MGDDYKANPPTTLEGDEIAVLEHAIAKAGYYVAGPDHPPEYVDRAADEHEIVIGFAAPPVPRQMPDATILCSPRRFGVYLCMNGSVPEQQRLLEVVSGVLRRLGHPCELEEL